MTVLCDSEIDQLCRDGMVDPFDPRLVNPASLDIRVGNITMFPTEQSRKWIEADISGNSEENPFFLMSGEFALLESLETFFIPETVCAQFILKSSRGREGWQHCLAGFCDPGWHGSKLTMEVHNVNPHHRLPLYPGLRIGQMRFDWMSKPPARSYAETGRYNGDRTVQLSKG